MKIKPKAIIYPDYNKGEQLNGVRLPYFYMHGDLEELVGYDCFNGNAYTFRNALRKGVSVVTIKGLRIGVCLGLMFTYYSEGHMQGLVVFINIEEDIQSAIDYIGDLLVTDMESTEKEYLKTNFPESYKLIFKS